MEETVAVAISAALIVKDTVLLPEKLPVPVSVSDAVPKLVLALYEVV